MMNPFLDDRPIPKLEVGLKVKIKTEAATDFFHWNKFFSYLMKKPKTKLTFITTSLLRKMQIGSVTSEMIKPFLSAEDLVYFNPISHLFDNTLPRDLKVFILAMLQIPIKIIPQNQD